MTNHIFSAWLWIVTRSFGFGMENFSYDRTKGNKEWVTKLEAKGLRLDMLTKLKYDNDWKRIKTIQSLIILVNIIESYQGHKWLRPMAINRWTITSYFSCWTVITLASFLFLTFWQASGTNVIWILLMFIHV